jgi:hypothetical protein
MDPNARHASAQVAGAQSNHFVLRSMKYINGASRVQQ